MSVDGVMEHPSANGNPSLGKGGSPLTTKRHRRKIVGEPPPARTTLWGRVKGETDTTIMIQWHDPMPQRADASPG
jgi:hypothetical protein